MNNVTRFVSAILFGFLIMVTGQVNAQQTEDEGDRLINKTYPELLKDEICEALAYYPELAETSIDFVFRTNIKNAYMQAQPKWHGIFQSKEKRPYVIKMTPVYFLKDREVPLQDLPHNVIVGWLVHELGHVLDYSERSGLSMVGFGLRYITSDRYKIEVEHTADLNAIMHGTADHIVACKNFIYQNTGLPLHYRKRIKRLYMSPEKVMQLAEKASEGDEEGASMVH